MKKKQEYIPIFSDALADTADNQQKETINAGISFLPSELGHMSEEEKKTIQIVHHDRKVGALFAAFQALTMSAAAVLLKTVFEAPDYNVVCVFVFLVAYLVYRLAILKRPMHPSAFSLFHIFLMGVIPYFLLTSGAAEYYGDNDIRKQHH